MSLFFPFISCNIFRLLCLKQKNNIFLCVFFISLPTKLSKQTLFGSCLSLFSNPLFSTIYCFFSLLELAAILLWCRIIFSLLSHHVTNKKIKYRSAAVTIRLAPSPHKKALSLSISLTKEADYKSGHVRSHVRTHEPVISLGHINKKSKASQEGAGVLLSD